MQIVKSKGLRTVLIMLVCLLGLWFAVPQMLTIHYQTRAGTVLDEFILQNANGYQDHFSCLTPTLAGFSKASLPELAHAIVWLELVARVTPNNAHTHYLLGQAYCLNGNYEQAVDAFEIYQRKRPENPLVMMEKSFAYFSWAQTLDETETALNATYMNRSILGLESAGIGGDLLSHHADIAYSNLDYGTAWVLYDLAETFRPLTDALTFRKLSLDVAFKQGQLSLSNLDSVEFVREVDGTLTIPPSAFFRLENGSPVSERDLEGAPAGMYYSNRDPGGTFVIITSSGEYCLVLNAFDAPPAPTIVELLLDFKPLLTIELSDGDNKWKTMSTKVYLEEGAHLFGQRLTNDEIVDGIDRNAHMGAFTLSACE